jgi:hypothetical protein
MDNKNQDQKLHKIFQLAAIIILGYIIYITVTGKGAQTINPNQVHGQAGAVVGGANIDAISKIDPAKFASFVDFISSVDSSPSDARILRSDKGFLVYLPKEGLNININGESNKVDGGSSASPIPASPIAEPPVTSTPSEPEVNLPGGDDASSGGEKPAEKPVDPATEPQSSNPSAPSASDVLGDAKSPGAEGSSAASVNENKVIVIDSEYKEQ